MNRHFVVYIFFCVSPLLKLGWLLVALYILQVDPPLIKDLAHVARATKMTVGHNAHMLFHDKILESYD